MKKTIMKVLYSAPIPPRIVDFVRKQQFLRTKCDQRSVEFYRQFIRPGDLVFDVGANMGNRSKVFLELGAKVVAFEPQKRCADFLKSVLKKEKNFILIEAALGGEEGFAEMLVSDTHVLSTLSRDWVEATKNSGRFSRNKWEKKQEVTVTTLGNAILEFGCPAFLKIDVEGFEYEVLSGLTRPVQSLSIEFAAEAIQTTCRCIERVSELSNVVFQFSAGESLEFYLPEWVSKQEMVDFLRKASEDKNLSWGDVYMKKADEDV